MEPVECDRGSVWDIFEPVKDSRILVWNRIESGCIKRTFVAMLEGQYICRSGGPNSYLIGWAHAKPVPKEPKVFWCNKYISNTYCGRYNTEQDAIEGSGSRECPGAKCLGQVEFVAGHKR